MVVAIVRRVSMIVTNSECRLFVVDDDCRVGFVWSCSKLLSSELSIVVTVGVVLFRVVFTAHADS
eukprot:9153330-Prorocentrum_lima.AAC.1